MVVHLFLLPVQYWFDKHLYPLQNAGFSHLQSRNTPTRPHPLVHSPFHEVQYRKYVYNIICVFVAISSITSDNYGYRKVTYMYIVVLALSIVIYHTRALIRVFVNSLT